MKNTSTNVLQPTGSRRINDHHTTLAEKKAAREKKP